MGSGKHFKEQSLATMRRRHVFDTIEIHSMARPWTGWKKGSDEQYQG
jgi:hypothetical protein